MSRFSIIVADDHPLFRRGLAEIIRADAAFQLLGEAGDGVAALTLIEQVRPEIAILDLDMPVQGGLAVVEALAGRIGAPAVVILTMHDDAELLDRALHLGVAGYLLKDTVAGDLLSCLHLVAAGRSYVSPALTGFLVQRGGRSSTAPGHAELTEAERRVLRLIAGGDTSPMIARALGIATKTVENHRSSICRKLDIHGPNALVRYATAHRAELR